MVALSLCPCTVQTRKQHILPVLASSNLVWLCELSQWGGWVMRSPTLGGRWPNIVIANCVYSRSERRMEGSGGVVSRKLKIANAKNQLQKKMIDVGPSTIELKPNATKTEQTNRINVYCPFWLGFYSARLGTLHRQCNYGVGVRAIAQVASPMQPNRSFINKHWLCCVCASFHCQQTRIYRWKCGALNDALHGNMLLRNELVDFTYVDHGNMHRREMHGLHFGWNEKSESLYALASYPMTGMLGNATFVWA